MRLSRLKESVEMVIAPVVPCDVEEVTESGNTERGEGGFGSTGKK